MAAANATPVAVDRPGKGALLVGAGILSSRLVGLVRQAVFAHFLGSSIPAAAFQAAARIPNFLQNLFGEGVLSASFIPVYARLLESGDQEEAEKVAGAVFGLLCLAMAVLVALGVFCAPLLVDTIAGGFHPEARALTIRLVRIVFPGTGLLVFSAWCLGILNSHRRFFLSYVAPVVWSGAQIAALFAFGWTSSAERLVELLAVAAVLGSALQVAIQLPTVKAVLGHFRPNLSLASDKVRQVLRGFGPVVLSRGVVQVSALVDIYFASHVSAHAFSVLAYAQMIYLLPISLFGMSISAAELPEMSRAGVSSKERMAEALKTRLDRGLSHLAFLVIPSAIAFLLLGDVVGGAILQSGHFRPDDTRLLWYLLMGSALGLWAATCARLYQSAFYALYDTKRPLLFSTIRVSLVAVLAWWAVMRMPAELGVPRLFGVVGITATTGVCAWVEFLLLRRSLQRRLGGLRRAWKPLGAKCLAAVVAGGVGLGVKAALTAWLGAAPRVALMQGGWLLPAPHLDARIAGVVVLLPFGLSYFGLCALFGIPEARALFGRVRALVFRTAR